MITPNPNQAPAFAGWSDLACIHRVLGSVRAPSSAKEDFTAFELRPDEVHVWRFGLSTVHPQPEQLERCLSPDELDRLRRLRFAADQQAFLRRRAVRRGLLAAYLKVDPGSIRFSASAFGKPAVVGQEFAQGLRFNCTHSVGTAVIAVSRGLELGVDVESRRSEVGDLLDLVLTPAERVEFGLLAPSLRYRTFFELWTCKEAVLKAAGLGLSYPLCQLEVGVEFAERAVVRTRFGGHEVGQEWWVTSLDVGNDCSATLAIAVGRMAT